MTHVERDHLAGATLQQDVREASCRGADVEGATSLDCDRKGIERVRELDTAAPDVWVIGGRHSKSRLSIYGSARLRHDLVVYGHVPAKDERTRTFARWREAVVDKEDIQTLFGFRRHS
jgi:hypothetical protein